MKTKIILLLLCVAAVAKIQAQTPTPTPQPQKFNAFAYQYKRTIVDSSVAFPVDTFPIHPSLQHLPHIAVKDSVLWLWSPAKRKYVIPKGFGGTALGTDSSGNDSMVIVTTWSEILGEISTNAQLRDSFLKKQDDLPFSGNSGDYLSGAGSFLSFASKLRSIGDTVYLRPADIVDLQKRLDTVYANVMATKLSDLDDVNTNGVLNEYVMKFNTSTLKWEAKPDKRVVDFVITRNGSYNTIYGKYQDGTLTLGKSFYDETGENTKDTAEIFEGYETETFTLTHEPSSIISITTGNVPFDEANYSFVGLLLTILNYDVTPSDRIIVKYKFPRP